MQDSTLHLSAAISTAGLNPSTILDKTKELLRLLQMKLPGGSLKKAEAYRHIIAIELACRVQNVPFEKTVLLNMAGKPNTNDYKKALCSCKTVLNLTWNSVAVFNVLSVQYGEDVRVDAENVLADYRMRQSETVAGKYISANVDFDSSLYQSAAFFLAAKRKKVKINKAALLQLAEIDSKVFHNVVEKIAKALEEPFETKANGDSTLSTRKPAFVTSGKGGAVVPTITNSNVDGDEVENSQNCGNVEVSSCSSSSIGIKRMTPAATSTSSGRNVCGSFIGVSSSTTLGGAFRAPESELVSSSQKANKWNRPTIGEKAAAAATVKIASSAGQEDIAGQSLGCLQEREEQPSRKRSDYETWREGVLQRKKAKAAAEEY